MESKQGGLMRSIWVTFRKEGIHKYPGADTDPRYATGDWDDVKNYEEIRETKKKEKITIIAKRTKKKGMRNNM